MNSRWASPSTAPAFPAYLTLEEIVQLGEKGVLDEE